MNQIRYENKEEKYLLKDNVDKRKLRNILFIILVFVFILGLILIFSSIGKINTIGNRESGVVDYKVYLKDNEFYQDKYLGKGMQYIASLIKSVNITFDYNNRYSSVVNYSYDYDIVAKILVTDKYDSSKVLYEKEEILLEGKNGKGVDDDFMINEEIDIDYDKYNSYVTAFKETYALDVDSNLIVTLRINYLGNYKGKDIVDKNSELTISIPLTKNTIDISMNTNKVDNNIDIAISDSKITNKFLFTIGIILTGISVLVTGFLVITIEGKNDIYRKEIDRLLKNYDRLIVTSSQPSIDESNYKNIIKVMTIEELIDVTEISNEPIIYYEVIPNEKSYFIVLKQDTLYKLIITRASLEKQKNEKKEEKKVEA